MPGPTRTRLLPAESTGNDDESRMDEYGTIPPRESEVFTPGLVVSRKDTSVTPAATPLEELRRAPALARRSLQLRRRRQRKILLWTLFTLGLFFPPFWPLYLIGWLLWRSRPQNKSKRRVRKAVHLIAQHRPGLALRELQDAHLLNPANHDALYWMGMLLCDQNRHEEAVEALSALNERMPGNPEVEGALVECCYAANRYEDTIEHAQTVLDRDPTNLKAILRLAESFERMGRIELAIEALRRAPLYRRRIDQDMKLILYRLAVLLEQKGERAEALTYFQRVCAADMGFQDACERAKRLES